MKPFLAVFIGALLSIALLYAAFGAYFALAVAVDPTRDCLEGLGMATFALFPAIAAAALPLFWYRPSPGVTLRVYLALLPSLIVVLCLFFISPTLLLIVAGVAPFAVFFAVREVCRD